MKQMKQITLTELINSLELELIRQGYKESTLNYYRTNWKHIKAYFELQNEDYFSERIAMKYVDNKCDFFAKEKANKLTQSNVYLFRVVRMMGDFAEHGTVLSRYHSTLSRVNDECNKKRIADFSVYCVAKMEYSKSTCKSYYRITENFISYLEANNIEISELTASIMTDFTKTLLGYSYKTVEFTLCGTRAFLRFLFNEGHIEKDLSFTIPVMQTRKQTKIPSVWDKADIEKLLNAIDRSNPCGKRDYAIILLVTKLGLRCIDVKHLKFSNFNWNNNYIELKQSKTHKIIRLPLLKDLGWAISDYLKNGRPISESDVIFLRHLAPIAPFSDEDHLHQIMMKYIRIAKIKTGNKKVGMHSLRHSLATTLLENNEPIDRISDILGHQSVDTTPTYLKSSINLLRECTLDMEV